MAATESSQPDEPPYPPFRQLERNYGVAHFSAATDRLYWRLEGVVPSAISVMKTARGADELEPFFRPDANARDGGTWHEIASLPLTYPKASSVEASVRELDEWESNWLKGHDYHSHEPEFNPEFVTYGDLSDDDRPWRHDGAEDGNWEEDSDTEFLIRCCGEDRPLGKRGLKMEVTPSAGNNFVTVRDYVSAVHPWLMGLRGDIIQAKRDDIFGYSGAYLPDGEWIVNITKPELEIRSKEDWVGSHRPPGPPDATTLRIMQRIAAERGRPITLTSMHSIAADPGGPMQ